MLIWQCFSVPPGKKLPISKEAYKLRALSPPMLKSQRDYSESVKRLRRTRSSQEVRRKRGNFFLYKLNDIVWQRGVEITCVNCIAMSSEMRAETDNIIYQGHGCCWSWQELCEVLETKLIGMNFKQQWKGRPPGYTFLKGLLL